MIFPIVKYGDPVLREKASGVTEVDDEIRELGSNMLETMYSASGVGLAAQQVGLTIAVCVVHVPVELDGDPDTGERFNPEIEMETPMMMINPKVTATAGAQVGEEGCLSFPEITLDIERPFSATVEYLDANGEAQTIEVHAFLARAIQHEIDHLNGVLFIDRVSQLKKLAIGGQLKRLKKKTEEAMSA